MPPLTSGVPLSVIASLGTPLVTAHLALATNPTETPLWTDVTPWLQAWSFSRGRQSELDTPQASSVTLVLDNRTRTFDPTYTAGPFYGFLKPRRRGRLQATYGGVTYDLCHFYVNRWPQAWANYGDATVTLQASGALAPLAGKALSGSFPEQLSGARINAVLDAVGWQTGTVAGIGVAQLDISLVLGPISDKNIAAGDSTMQAVTLSTTNALAHIQAVEQSENGLFFESRDGTLTFHNRRRRIGGTASTPFATFGEDSAGGELLYRDVTPEYDDTRLWNEVRLTRTGGTEQVATDTASQAEYFVSTAPSHESLVTTDAEVLSAAQYLLARYAQPILRLIDLTLSGHEPSGQVWPQLLTRDLGDCVLVRKRPPAGGNVIEQRSWIEGIRMAWSAEAGWDDTHWSLSPADTTAYWTIGTSKLGVDTTLAY